MHTPEEASALWCPMARVAQFGATETSASYNRSLSTMHRPVTAAFATPENFQLGDDPPPTKTVMILEINSAISGASKCISDECAMWRWGTTEHIPAHMEPGKLYAAERVQSTTHGYCGLAGRPGVL